jgi:hypothetical protein
MHIDLGAINWLAVLVAALGTFMLGGLWYTALFGKAWRDLHGWTDEHVKEMQAKRPPQVFFTVMLVSYFVLAIVIALLVQAAGATTYAEGALLGLLLWLGPVTCVKLTDHIASDVSFGVFGIDAVYQLMYMAGMGALIGGWR